MISHDSTEAAARGYVLPYPHPVAQGACMSSADTAEDQRLDTGESGEKIMRR
jgi:hypothetical protein